MKSTLVTLAKFTVTVALLIVVFRKVDFHEFARAWSGTKLDVLVLAFVVLWAGHYICIFRWRMLMKPLMAVPSLSNLFGIYCIGLFFNLTFPTVVGGDVVKMYYAGRPSKQYAESFASTFLDRDAGMFAMMIIACAVIVFHPVSVPHVAVAFIIWTAFAAFTFANIMIFTPSLHRVLTTWLIRLQMGKTAARIDAISQAFQVMAKYKGVLTFSLVISLINQLLVMAVTWIMAIALNLDVPFFYFLIFVPVITLISMIPISLNGMGLREYSFMSLFGAIGVSRESCVALGLLSSAFIVLSSLPGGLVYVFFRGRGDAQQMAVAESDMR